MNELRALHLHDNTDERFSVSLLRESGLFTLTNTALLLYVDSEIRSFSFKLTRMLTQKGCTCMCHYPRR